MHPEQKTSNCLNCDHPVSGKFCSNCGQKTSIPHDSFFHMLLHFVSDYFHYDGKFWGTLKLLLLKPGQLTLNYITGKRASYLLPVQLYIFVSAVFFLIFFKLVHVNVSSDGRTFKALYSLEKPRKPDLTDSAFVREERQLRKERAIMLSGKRDIDSTYAHTKPSFSAEYLKVYMANVFINYAIRAKFYTASQILGSLMTSFIHSIPKMLFFLMPALALLLKLFFRRKDYLYVDHAIMSLHLHSFLFISFITSFIFSFVKWDDNWIELVFLFIIPVFYSFLSFHRFYQYSLINTIFRGILTLASYLLLVVISALLNLFVLMRWG
jgi:hypothetical protein